MLRRFCVAALPLLCALFASPSRAGTYKIVIYPANATPIAVNDYGDFTLLVGTGASPGDPTPCGIGEVFCYLTYYNASGGYDYSLSRPTLAVDPFPPAPGPGCPPSPLPPDIDYELCENGHFFYVSNGPPVRGLFDGPNIYTDRIFGGSVDGAPRMTQNGNLLYIDGVDDSVIEITDLTAAPAPEPSSVALLGTGLLGLAGVVRRRFI